MSQVFLLWNPLFSHRVRWSLWVVTFDVMKHWSSTTKKNIKKLQNVQNFAARIIIRSRKFDRISPVLKELKWLSVQPMHICKDCILVFKCLRSFAPDYLAKMFKKKSKLKIHGIRIRWTSHDTGRPQAKEPSIIEQFLCGITYLEVSLS